VKYLTLEEQEALRQEILGRLTVATSDAMTAVMDECRDREVTAADLLLEIDLKVMRESFRAMAKLGSEIYESQGQVPTRAPLVCPDGECRGYLVVERKLFERVPVVGLTDTTIGEPAYLEGVRAELECHDIWVGLCSECGAIYDPATYRKLTARPPHRMHSSRVTK
jgi:hypothetical protein